jgi:cytoskeleton-associated protein 5
VRGDAILDHLTRINDPHNSELVAYLRKLVNNGVGKENANGDSNENMKNGNSNKSQIPSSIGNAGGTSSGGKIPRFTKSDHDALAEIFRKIGQKELTKQGLQELYNFKQQNPHADLEPFLIKSSEYFRNYIGKENPIMIHSDNRD